MTRTCQGCGKEFGPRGRDYKRFKIQKYCSVACVQATHTKNRLADTRKCEQCGKDYMRRYNEDKVRFSKRKYCSNDCAKIAQKEKSKENLGECTQCGKTFMKYKHRKFCSMACYRKHPKSWRKRQYINDLPEVWEPWQIAREFEYDT